WEIGVPVVEGEGDAANHFQKAGACAVRDLRHCGNNGETVNAVRAVFTNGVHVRGRRHFNGLFVIDTNETTLAALADLRLALFWILLGRAPRQHWVAAASFGLAGHSNEAAAGMGLSGAGRSVGAPG